MTEKFDNIIKSLSSNIRRIAGDLRVDNLVSILRVADMIGTILNIELKKHGVNYNMLGIMYLLTTHGGSMTPTDLSKKIFLTKQAITFAVDSLEDAALVKREPVGSDRRIRKIKITQKGINLVKESIVPRRELMFSIMSSLNRKEMESMSYALKKLRNDLPKQIEKSKNQSRANALSLTNI